ncbi:sulfate permease [Salinibacterium sp. ZJ450]|uniref:sulfate permease n=1 Tax=Salinibacterium sp. ZJ450 TaxID=2708338 RepID=UPI0014202F89|nr:sulfate permease [Salinibacterium sp. ZJ450]
MFRLLWVFSVRVSIFFWRNMPTNILLNALRMRRGLKWGVPGILLAVPYLVAAWLCSAWVAGGGPGWVHLLVLLFVWNALKFIANGPITLVLLLRARQVEHQARKAYERDLVGYQPNRQMGPLTRSISG